MSIATGKGDDGSTGLIGGQRVPKDDPRLEAYGTVDELNAAIGMARATDLSPAIDRELGRISEWLFALGSDLATPHRGPDNKKPPLLPAGTVPELEEWIHREEGELEDDPADVGSHLDGRDAHALDPDLSRRSEASAFEEDRRAPRSAPLRDRVKEGPSGNLACSRDLAGGQGDEKEERRRGQSRTRHGMTSRRSPVPRFLQQGTAPGRPRSRRTRRSESCQRASSPISSSTTSS